MKNQQILIRLDPEQLDKLNQAFKEALVTGNPVLSRSEFIRQALLRGIQTQK